jgi:hypothetical protein
MSGTKVSIKYGFGKPQTGSLKKAELAIDLKDLSLWTAESDGSEPVRVGHDTTEIEGEIDQINIDIQLNTEAIDQLDKDAVKKNVSTMQEMIGKLKAVGFVGDGSELSGITADQLDDVDTSAVKRDDFLIYNGTNWVAEDFHIDTELTYQGGIALSSPAPSGPANGDLYINNADGVVHPSWTGIGGQTVKAGNVVGWAANKSRWFLLGDIASSSVTDVEGGLGISVDDSKPAEPIVSIDRVETDKWYEPKFSKNTAFNKAFGTASGQVAQGNHLHTGVYQPVGDYALKSYSYSKAESDAKYELKGQGGAPSTDTLQTVTTRGNTTDKEIISVAFRANGPSNTGAPTTSVAAAMFLNGGKSSGGEGGELRIGAFNNAKGFAAIKGSIIDAGGNTKGDLDFYTRKSSGDAAMTRALRLSSNGNAVISGYVNALTLRNANNTVGDKFTVAANGHTVVKSVTSPSNLAGTHGSCTFIFGQGFGDSPGNVKSTSTIATGKYHCDWNTGGNFFAGQIAIMATGAVSDYFSYSVNTVSTGFFEGADLFTYENNIKGKQISFMMFAGVPSNSSVSPASINFDQEKYDQYMTDMEKASEMEFCGGGHDDVFVMPNAEGCLTLTTPYYSDYDFCIPHLKTMVKAKRSELPSSLLHNAFRLDGKKILVDLDAARADVERQFTDTLAALMTQRQNVAMLTGDQRHVTTFKETYTSTIEQIRKGDEKELARILIALSDLSAEFVALR